MRFYGMLIAAAFTVVALDARAGPTRIELGNATPFAVLAGSAVTGTGPTLLLGSLGVWPGTAVTGFPPGLVTEGATHDGDPVAMAAQADLTSAYLVAAAEPGFIVLTGHDLGGMVLLPGAYAFSTSAQLTGTLVLDAQGDAGAVFLFQIGSTLTTASGAVVEFIHGGSGAGLFWQVGSSATLGTDTRFAGSILALTDITLTTGASIDCGRALARNGTVTLDSNRVSIAAADCALQAAQDIGEPPALVMFAGVVLLAAAAQWRRGSAHGTRPARVVRT